MREIEEEVGLREISLVTKAGNVNYFYKRDGVLIFKTVHVYLVRSSGNELLSIQTGEIQHAEWFRPDVALRTVQYRGAKQLLSKALALFVKK